MVRAYRDWALCTAGFGRRHVVSDRPSILGLLNFNGSSSFSTFTKEQRRYLAIDLSKLFYIDIFSGCASPLSHSSGG